MSSLGYHIISTRLFHSRSLRERLKAVRGIVMPQQIPACRIRREGVFLDYATDPPFTDNELQIKWDTVGTFSTPLKTDLYGLPHCSS